MYDVQCTANSVQCKVFSIQCIKYIVQGALKEPDAFLSPSFFLLVFLPSPVLLANNFVAISFWTRRAANNKHQHPPTHTNRHQQTPTNTNKHQQPPTVTNRHQQTQIMKLAKDNWHQTPDARRRQKKWANSQ